MWHEHKRELQPDFSTDPVAGSFPPASGFVAECDD
jgi:hypothetical protein